MSESISEITTSKCDICGITSINGCFYWSNNSKQATADEVYSKVCKLAREKGKTEGRTCINTQGSYIKGLSWGESLEDKLILNFKGFTNEQNSQKEYH